MSVDFGNVFDAGVLLLHVTEHRWAKLCYELSPQRRPTAVTVVTRGTSDDSNSFAMEGGPVWLRITRKGRAWAFHASQDGAWWHLLRYFTLGEASGARVGFLAQSPKGWAAPPSSTRSPTAPAARPTSGTGADRDLPGDYPGLAERPVRPAGPQALVPPQRWPVPGRQAQASVTPAPPWP